PAARPEPPRVGAPARPGSWPTERARWPAWPRADRGARRARLPPGSARARARAGRPARTRSRDCSWRRPPPGYWGRRRSHARAVGWFARSARRGRGGAAGRRGRHRDPGAIEHAGRALEGRPRARAVGIAVEVDARQRDQDHRLVGWIGAVGHAEGAARPFERGDRLVVAVLGAPYRA